MEISSKFKEREHLLHHHSPSPLNSPNTNNGNTTTHNTLPITRSDPNSPYPTTFVTADTSSFKQVVQMLTGSSESTTPKSNTSKHIQTSPRTNPTTSSNNNNNAAEAACSSQQAASAKNYIIPPIKTTQPKKQGFKLYERRNSIKHLISPLNAASASFQTTSFSFSPRHKQEILSPSLLDFPSLTLSPVTPLVEDPFDKSSPSIVVDRTCCGPTTMAATSSSSLEEQEEEDKAIAEKGFYLHPSPISTPRDSEPQLLPLFPLESPRVSES